MHSVHRRLRLSALRASASKARAVKKKPPLDRTSSYPKATTRRGEPVRCNVTVPDDASPGFRLSVGSRDRSTTRTVSLLRTMLNATEIVTRQILPPSRKNATTSYCIANAVPGGGFGFALKTTRAIVDRPSLKRSPPKSERFSGPNTGFPKFGLRSSGLCK